MSRAAMGSGRSIGSSVSSIVDADTGSIKSKVSVGNSGMDEGAGISGIGGGAGISGMGGGAGISGMGGGVIISGEGGGGKSPMSGIGGGGGKPSGAGIGGGGGNAPEPGIGGGGGVEFSSSSAIVPTTATCLTLHLPLTYALGQFYTNIVGD